MLNTKEIGARTYRLTWEGLYKVMESFKLNTYRLVELDGKLLNHPWNAEYLKIYYQ